MWLEGPPERKPGGFAYSTVRIANAPGGAIYEIGLEFDVPRTLYPQTDYWIDLPPQCADDLRLFSSRIVVADAGSEGQRTRTHRPQYYKVPGRRVESFRVRVPDGRPSNIYLLAVPTPPFDLEDVHPYVSGFSIVWTYRYSVRRLSDSSGLQAATPILLEGDETLSLTKQDPTSHGFAYDCFHALRPPPSPSPSPPSAPLSAEGGGCPARAPSPGAPCAGSALRCEYDLVCCPGGSTCVNTTYAECEGSSWLVAIAGAPVCPATLTVPLDEGWSWFSINVALPLSALDAALGSIASSLAQGDSIKSMTEVCARACVHLCICA